MAPAVPGVPALMCLQETALRPDRDLALATELALDLVLGPCAPVSQRAALGALAILSIAAKLDASSLTRIRPCPGRNAWCSRLCSRGSAACKSQSQAREREGDGESEPRPEGSASTARPARGRRSWGAMVGREGGRGERVRWRGGRAHLPWPRRPSPVARPRHPSWRPVGWRPLAVAGMPG